MKSKKNNIISISVILFLLLVVIVCGVKVFKSNNNVLNGAKRINLDGAHKSPKTVFKEVNQKILNEISKGNLVWRQGWKMGVVVKGRTYGIRNHESQRPYQGGNAFYIEMQNLLNGTDYVEFLTRKQILKRGWKLKPNATPFVVSAFIKSTQEQEFINEVTGETETLYRLMRGVVMYNVYPVQHIIGFEPIKFRIKENTKEDDIIFEAQEIIDNMPKCPQIKHGGDQPAYFPTRDFIQMPFKTAFKNLDNYYSVLFHELSHSTGHSKRLGRGNDTRLRDGSLKDKKEYAFEELIAELSASYLSTISELKYYNPKQSAAYLASWSKRLETEIKADPAFLQKAVYKAVKATTYILGNNFK